MPYVGADGKLVESRPFSIQSVIDFFRAIIDFIIFFFRSLFRLDEPSVKGQYGRQPSRGNGSAPNFPRRRMGGFGSSGGSPGAPPCAPGGG